MDDAALLRRAHAAYLRAGGTATPGSGSGVRTHAGKHYVVLEGGHGPGPMRVYRVLPNGRLKGLRRWPEEIL